MFGRVGAQEPSASATTTNRNCIFTSRPISILRIDSHEFMYSGNLAQFDELGWRIEADWLNAASTCINNKSPRKDCRQQFASLGATPRGNGRWNSRPVLPDDFASSPTSLPIRPRPKGTSPGRWTGDDPSLQRLPSHRLPTHYMFGLERDRQHEDERWSSITVFGCRRTAIRAGRPARRSASATTKTRARSTRRSLPTMLAGTASAIRPRRLPWRTSVPF